MVVFSRTLSAKSAKRWDSVGNKVARLLVDLLLSVRLFTTICGNGGLVPIKKAADVAFETPQVMITRPKRSRGIREFMWLRMENKKLPTVLLFYLNCYLLLCTKQYLIFN